jgi:hypothetical protein
MGASRVPVHARSGCAIACHPSGVADDRSPATECRWHRRPPRPPRRSPTVSVGVSVLPPDCCVRRRATCSALCRPSVPDPPPRAPRERPGPERLLSFHLVREPADRCVARQALAVHQTATPATTRRRTRGGTEPHGEIDPSRPTERDDAAGEQERCEANGRCTTGRAMRRDSRPRSRLTRSMTVMPWGGSSPRRRRGSRPSASAAS